MAIDRPEVAALVGPFVPDRDAVLVEIFDVGVAGQEPKQLVDDRLEMQLLGGDERKALGEIKAHLMPEHRQRAGAGAVTLLRTVGEDPLHQVVILMHPRGLAWLIMSRGEFSALPAIDETELPTGSPAAAPEAAQVRPRVSPRPQADRGLPRALQPVPSALRARVMPTPGAARSRSARTAQPPEP